jgi:hypothetical protein
MADSENSTSLAGVTRRSLLAGTATAPLLPILPRDHAAAVDPILPLWRDWQKLDAEAGRWCRRWQTLEAALVRAHSVPRVKVSRAPAATAIWATTHRDIDDALEEAPDADALRTGLHADLDLLQARWDEAAEACGLHEAGRREEEAWNRREALAATIFAQSARDAVGIAAKLSLIVRMGEASADDEEFPWPQIRSALVDLRRISGISAEMFAV